MKTKSILILAPYGFNDRMTNFIEFVSARLLAKSGWKVTALTRVENNAPTDSIVHGVRVVRYKESSDGIRAAIKLLRTERPSIIHVHNLRNNRVGIATAIIAKWRGIPLAFTEYGLLHDHYLVTDREDPFIGQMTYELVVSSLAQLFGRSILKPWMAREYFMSYFFHWPLTHADAAAFVSKHNIPVAKKLGVQDVRLLPHLSDEVRFEDTKTEDVNENDRALGAIIQKLPQDGFGLFIGQMKLRKGWDVLIKAIPHVAPGTVAMFAIVANASPNEVKPLEALAEELGVRDRIVILRKISNQLLDELYKKSAMLIVPSRYEGFGLTPLEAFEKQKPVVASAVEALTDYLVDGQNAALVPPKDPVALAAGITRVATDSPYRHRLLDGGTHTLAEFRSQAYVLKWLHFYDSLLKN